MFEYDYQKLPKADKKLVQELIDIGIQREYATGLNEIAAEIDTWRNQNTHNGETFSKINDMTRDFNKYAYRMYGNLRGSNFLDIIVYQLSNNILTETDIEPLSENTKTGLKQIAERRRS